MKILIIDDNLSLRYMLSEICEHAGWTPMACENGAVGVQKFSEEHPDLVLVDYHMPEMDGIEVVRAIREINHVVPILALTVDERQEIADEFLQAGATDFALKPVKAPDIIARIQLHARLANVLNYKDSEEVFTVKGISKATLSHIIQCLSSKAHPVSVADLSREAGLAYPTVYRYIMHLLEDGRVVQEESQQRIGRPKKLYKWFTN
ncbi:response regulator [Bacillus sp. SCS-153A]|uniref:response regulator n=1 Tax=Rossellomorea sedimentorum TaxID=3115294 RepID=UPI003905A436